MKIIISLALIILSTSCAWQEQKKVNSHSSNDSLNGLIRTQIGEYVTDAFEDSNGHLWFGTIGQGIAKHDGSTLKYLLKKDGLPSNRVTGVTEDSKGNFWFITGDGISKLNENKFINYRINEADLYSNMVSQFFIDSKGKIWIGTWGGVYKFDGKEFSQFAIPYPDVRTTINEDTKNWITDIEEDSDGNMWFGRDGYGACMYNGKSFTHFLKKDGLHSNNITQIEFDTKGDVWFGTRVAEKDNPNPGLRIGKGGINKLIKNTIISFPEIEGFNNSDVHEIHLDKSGNIWIGTINNGVYKYDGEDFKNYDVPISVMKILDDTKGNLWLAGAGGLFKLDKKGAISNVTTNGPW